MKDKKAIDIAQRYIATQRKKIHAQSKLVRHLEANGEDESIVRMERQTLREMGKSLDLVCTRLRLLMNQAG
jgi:hypothetical protein